MNRIYLADVKQALVVLNNTADKDVETFQLCLGNGGVRLQIIATGSYVGPRGTQRETYYRIDAMIDGWRAAEEAARAALEKTVTDLGLDFDTANGQQVLAKIRGTSIPVRYEVQTAMGNDWENCWTENEKPQYFESEDAAQAEITDHLDTVADAVAAGHMQSEYDPADYRIMPVFDCPECSGTHPFRHDFEDVVRCIDCGCQTAGVDVPE